MKIKIKILKFITLIVLLCLEIQTNAAMANISLVPGSPFNHPITTFGTFGITYSPNGKWCAWTNTPETPDAVNVASVAQDGALDSIAYSPFGPTAALPESIAYSPDSKFLVVANQGEASLTLFSVNQTTGELTYESTTIPEANHVGTVIYAPNEKFLAGSLLTEDYLPASIKMFSVNSSTGALTSIGVFPTNHFISTSTSDTLAFSPDSKFIAQANIDTNSITIFHVDQKTGDLGYGIDYEVPYAEGSSFISIAYSPDGAFLAVADESNILAIFTVDPTTGVPTWASTITTNPYTMGNQLVAFSPDSQFLALAYDDSYNTGQGFILVYNIDTYGNLTQFGDPLPIASNNLFLEDIAFSPINNEKTYFLSTSGLNYKPTITSYAFEPYVYPPTHLEACALQRGNTVTNVITWTTPESGVTPIQYYEIFTDPYLYNRIATISAAEPLIYEIPDLDPSMTYTYYIVSFDSYGHMSEPASITVTQTCYPTLFPPSTISGCFTTVGNTITNTITWTHPTSGAAPTQYQIFSDSDLYNLLETVPASSPLIYQQSNLDPYLMYTYYVVSADAYGDTSEPVSITVTQTCYTTPFPPASIDGCILQRGNTVTNVITWTPPAYGATPSEYQIFTDPSLTYRIATIPATDPLIYEIPNLDPNITYTYYIVSADAHGDTSEPVSVTLTQTCYPTLFPPASINGCALQRGNTVTNVITWTSPSSGSTPASYEIFTDPSLTYRIATIPATDPLIYEVPDLDPNITYTYYIVSADAHGDTSEPVSVTLTQTCYPTLFPPASINGCALQKSSTVTNVITWTPPSSGSTPASYEIFTDPYLHNRIATIPATDPLIYEVPDLDPNITYTYYIVSADAYGDYSEPVSITVTETCYPTLFPPASIDGCILQRGNTVTNVITWTPPAYGATPSEYQIFTDPSLTYRIATIPATDPLIYEIPNLDPNITYTYYIVSADAYGDYSEPVSVTVTATCYPTLFPPASIDGCILQRGNTVTNVITWTPPAYGATPSEYQIFTDPSLTYRIATIPATDPLIYEIPNLDPNITYTYYIVSADTHGGTSEPVSVTVTATCYPTLFPPASIDGCILQRGNTVTNVITWTPPAHGQNPTEYQIFTDPYLTYLIATIPATGQLVYEAPNLDPNITYTYYIVSADAYGDSSEPASVTVTATCYPTLFPPASINGCIFQQGNTVTNVITWTPPAHGQNPTEYQIFTDPYLTYLIATIPATGQLVYEAPNLDPNIIHTYYIVSADAYGDTSEPVSVTVSKPCASAPLPPTNVMGIRKFNVFLDKTERILTITWSPSSSTNVTSYNVYNGTTLMGNVSASQALTFNMLLRNDDTGQNVSITAVNVSGIESVHVPVIIA